MIVVQRRWKLKKLVLLSILVVVVLLAVALIAEAQQPKKVARIGYLAAGDAASESSRAEAIRLALRAFGYLEGQNIATEYRYAEGKRDRFLRIGAKRTRSVLVRLRILGNCANRSAYEYGAEDIDKIFRAIEDELRETRRKFEPRKKRVDFEL
jgi:hypothetical protein